MILATPTIQVPRCAACPGLTIAIFARTASGGGNLAAGFYSDYAYTDDSHNVHAAHWYEQDTRADGEAVSFTYTAGPFSPTANNAGTPYAGGYAANSPSSEFTPDDLYTLASGLLATALTSAVLTPAEIGFPFSIFSGSSGVGNVSSSGGEIPYYDEYTNNTSTFQEVGIEAAQDVTFRVALPYPYLAGTYQTSYRLKHHIQRRVDHHQAAPEDADVTDTTTYDAPVMLAATPAVGATSFDFPTFDLPTPAIGETVAVVGPPGALLFTLTLESIGGEVEKLGFHAYSHTPEDGDNSPRAIYLTETASGDGFSGSQTYNPDPASDEPRSVDFSDSVPRDAAAPSYPGGNALTTLDGNPSGASLKTQSATVSQYFVPTAPVGQQNVTFTLSDENTTAALMARIDPTVEAGTAYGPTTSFFADRILSEGETYYRRCAGRLLLSAELGSMTVDPAVLGTGSLDYAVKWDKVTTDLDAGTTSTDTESWDVSLTAAAPNASFSQDYPSPSGNGFVRLVNFRTDPLTDDRIEGALVATISG